jgi:ankyrin repeat protein
MARRPPAPPQEARPQAESEPVKPTPVALVEPLSLHAVVAKGDFENARKLVEQGADVEAKDPGTGASVLHYAVMRGNPEILQFLLGRGVDVNSRTRNGTTPLHTAVLYNRYEVAEMLLNKGADVGAKSSSGATPLAIATAAKNRTIAELLRARGAQ